MTVSICQCDIARLALIGTFVYNPLTFLGLEPPSFPPAGFCLASARLEGTKLCRLARLGKTRTLELFLIQGKGGSLPGRKHSFYRSLNRICRGTLLITLLASCQSELGLDGTTLEPEMEVDVQKGTFGETDEGRRSTFTLSRMRMG